MTATQLSNPNSIVVAGHVMAFDASGARLMAYSGAPTAIANATALAAVTGARDGQDFQIQSDGSNWRYVAASTLTTDATSTLVITATGMGSGAFLRTDKEVDIKMPIGFATADAAVLYTVPAGFRLQVGVSWWEVTTGWTGGSSSAIGLHSGTSTSFGTKGDILGGASGDVAATLVSTGALAKGTAGAKNGNPSGVLVGADTIVFDRITSAFTAGAGFAHVPVKIALAPTS